MKSLHKALEVIGLVLLGQFTCRTLERTLTGI